MTGADRWLVFVLFLVSGLLLAWKTTGFAGNSQRVEVILADRTILNLTLAEQEGKTGRYPLELPGGGAVLEVKDGAVRLTSPGGDFCPRKTCVHTGWIGKPGEAIICVPNRLVIRITKGGGNPVDAVSR